MTYLIYLLLTLFAVNFMSVGLYIMIGVIVLVVMRSKKLIVTKDFWLLIIFMVTYEIFNIAFSDEISIKGVILILPFTYLAGLNFMDKPKDEDIRKIILFFAIAFTAHGILNFVYEIIISGGINFNPVHYDIWTRQISSVTGQMTNFSIFAACFGYFIYKDKIDLLFIVLLVISVVFNLVSGGRSYFFLLAISYVVSTVLVLTSKMENKLIRLGKLTLLLLLMLAVFLIAYNRNWFGINDIYKSSYFYNRFLSINANHEGSIIETGRWDSKLAYMQYMLQYPFGGGKIREITNTYAHELWLDVYDEAGAPAYIICIVYTVSFIRRMLSYSFRYVEKLENKIMIVCFLAVSMAQFFVEPVVSGSPLLLLAFVFVDGMMTSSSLFRNPLSVSNAENEKE